MPLRRLLPVVLLVLSVPALVLPQTGQSGGSEGERDLALGLAAYAGQRYEEAVEHLSQAIGELSRGESRAALAEAYLRLGMTYLVGLESPGQALPAFLRSAELGTEPATAYLWASLAARKLGDAGAAERLETQALAAGPARPATIEERAETPEAAPAAQPDAFGYFFRGEKEETTGAAVAPARQRGSRPGPGRARP
jgi:tetratricopeptide (TPR) repeat protein